MFLVPMTRRSASDLVRSFDRLSTRFRALLRASAQAADDTPRSPALDVRESRPGVHRHARHAGRGQGRREGVHRRSTRQHRSAGAQARGCARTATASSTASARSRSYARRFKVAVGHRSGRVRRQAGKRCADAELAQTRRPVGSADHRQLTADGCGARPAGPCRTPAKPPAAWRAARQLRPATDPSAGAHRTRPRPTFAAVSPRCSRIAAASAIMAPLSVHSASSG